MQSSMRGVKGFSLTAALNSCSTFVSPGWVARETYRFLNNDEFIETFALAGPGKEFETYSETRFRRKK